MKATLKRLGILPYLVLGLSLVALGLLAMNHAVDNWWPFDVARLDLVRATAIDQVDPAALMESVNVDIVFAFLCAAFSAAMDKLVAYHLSVVCGLQVLYE